MVNFEVSDKNKKAIDCGENFIKESSANDKIKNELVEAEFLNNAPGIFYGRNAILRSLIGNSTQFTNANFVRMTLFASGDDLITLSSRTADGQSN